MLAPAKPAPPKAVETAIAAITVPSRARLIRHVDWDRPRREREDARHVRLGQAGARAWRGRPASIAGQPARVALTAVGRTAPPTSAAECPTPSPPLRRRRVPAPARVTFEAKPGKIQLRLSVEGAASGGASTRKRGNSRFRI